MREVVREHLLVRLNEPMPLLILEGLPGSGRTTLLRQWQARAAEFPRILVELLVGLSHAQDSSDIFTRLAGVESDAEALAALSDLIGRRRLTIALTGLDRLPPAVALGLLATARNPPPRFIIEVADAVDLVAGLADRRLPYSLISDKEFYFTRGELMRSGETGPAASDRKTIAVLHQETLGHPGSVALARRIIAGAFEARAGRLLPHLDLAELKGTRLHDFVGAVSVVPRISLELASRHLDQKSGRYFSRFVESGLGEIQPDEALGGPVFRWDAGARAGLVRQWRQDRPAWRSGALKLAEAARRSGDDAAAVVALIETGDLGGAEAAAGSALWELSQNPEIDFWRPLIDLPRARLRPHPALLVMHTQLDAQTRALGVAEDVRVRTDAGHLLSVSGAAPAERLGQLACGAQLALLAGDLPLAEDACRRWLVLAEESAGVAGERGVRRLASDALMVARALVQLDHFRMAIRAAEKGMFWLDGDPRGLGDPSGRRRATVRRLRTAAARMAGYRQGNPGSEPEAPGAPFDLVLDTIAATWKALDDGDLPAADRASGAAIQRIDDPRSWPALLLTRAFVQVVLRRKEELTLLWHSYLASPRWRQRQFREARTGANAAVLDLLVSRALGLRPSSRALDDRQVRELVSIWPVAGPLALLSGSVEADPPSEEELSAAAPRMRQSQRALMLLQSLRSGNLDQARRVILACHADWMSGFQLAPVELVFFTAADMDLLRVAAAGLPPSARIPLSAIVRDFVERLPTAPVVELSQRETDILRCLQRGRSAREIASELYISINTVKFHRANLYRKLEVGSRDAAIAAAISAGLL